MPVLIRSSDLQFIMSHAKSTYPEECCGFLLGLDSGVRTRGFWAFESCASIF